jgi:hypothetical protein
MGDATGAETGHWIIWDQRAQRHVRLHRSAVVRENQLNYRFARDKWEKLIGDGDHAFWDARVAFQVWKPNSSTIAVVEWPAPEGSHQLPSYIWCVRYEIELARSPTSHTHADYSLRTPPPPPVVCGARVLWPLEPDFAKSIYVKLQDKNPELLLLHHLPHNHVENTERHPFPWSCHPLASKEPFMHDHFGNRLMLATIRPLLDGDYSYASVASRMTQRSKYSELPLAMAGVPKARPKKGRASTSTARPFEQLSDDLTYKLVHELATEYVNHPAWGAHRGWTALRAVSVAFRDAADEAATDLMNGLYSGLRCLEDHDDEGPIIQLRGRVIPTGLNLLWLAEAYQWGVMAGHCNRLGLLCYMKARSGRHQLEVLPDPPPPPPPAEVDQRVRISYSHGGPCWYEDRKLQLEHEQRTRSKAPLLGVVTLMMRVDPWRVGYMKGQGWHVE